MTTTVKHREVARALRDEIKAGRWRAGEKLPGELELAREYGVAHMTLRQAIGGLVDGGLLVRVRGKGTFVEDRSRDARPATLHEMALVIPSSAQTTDPLYYPELLMSFQQEIAARGLQTKIQSYETVENPDALEPSSAVACVMVVEEHLHLVERLRDAGHLVLAINRYSGRRAIPCIRIDDEGGVGQAVDHLASLGHRRIGFVRGPVDNLDAADRLSGYRSAINRHGLSRAYETGDGFNEACGYKAMTELLALSDRPTAVVCASDLSAIGAIMAAREAGLSVPRALSVVGFGDFSVADFIMPRLTTVRQSRSALGRTSARALISLAMGQGVEGEVLSAELIVRESTRDSGGERG
ncbi:MAG: GntR family transcriptional regulator [Capsulimonadaceae bacterium]|nr:GntR family transcriptional regulator [Capsulimonadaceae bacterium]